MADKKKRMRTGGIKKNPKMITEGLNENKLEEEDFRPYYPIVLIVTLRWS